MRRDQLSEAELKRRVARAILDRVGDLLTPDVRRKLRVVAGARDDLAIRWAMRVRLADRVEIEVGESFVEEGKFGRPTANYSAVGEEDWTACARLAALTHRIADLTSTLQTLVESYNAGRA